MKCRREARAGRFVSFNEHDSTLELEGKSLRTSEMEGPLSPWKRNKGSSSCSWIQMSSFFSKFNAQPAALTSPGNC